MIPFEYGVTKLEDGYYIVKETRTDIPDDGEIQAAEYMMGSWCQCGSDYDYWQYSHPNCWKIEVLARIHLPEMRLELL